MKKVLLWIGGILLVLGFIAYSIFSWAVSVNNEIVVKNEAVTAAWSNVTDRYKRRADMVPQLVSVVSGYAKHEKETLEGVTLARSKATSIQLTPEALKDPEAMKKFQEAQTGLTQALSKLMMLQEKYPDLKANTLFADLQTQIEGTENRISVARRDYISAVQSYNVLIKQFPASFIASFRGFAEKPNFQVEDPKALEKAPDINFNK